MKRLEHGARNLMALGLLAMANPTNDSLARDRSTGDAYEITPVDYVSHLGNDHVVNAFRSWADGAFTHQDVRSDSPFGVEPVQKVKNKQLSAREKARLQTDHTLTPTDGPQGETIDADYTFDAVELTPPSRNRTINGIQVTGAIIASGQGTVSTQDYQTYTVTPHTRAIFTSERTDEESERIAAQVAQATSFQQTLGDSERKSTFDYKLLTINFSAADGDHRLHINPDGNLYNDGSEYDCHPQNEHPFSEEIVVTSVRRALGLPPIPASSEDLRVRLTNARHFHGQGPEVHQYPAIPSPVYPDGPNVTDPYEAIFQQLRGLAGTPTSPLFAIASTKDPSSSVTQSSASGHPIGSGSSEGTFTRSTYSTRTETTKWKHRFPVGTTAEDITLTNAISTSVETGRQATLHTVQYTEVEVEAGWETSMERTHVKKGETYTGNPDTEIGISTHRTADEDGWVWAEEEVYVPAHTYMERSCINHSTGSTVTSYDNKFDLEFEIHVTTHRRNGVIITKPRSCKLKVWGLEDDNSERRMNVSCKGWRVEEPTLDELTAALQEMAR